MLGDREVETGTVMVRDLTSGEQNPCPLGDVVAAVRSILESAEKPFRATGPTESPDYP